MGRVIQASGALCMAERGRESHGPVPSRTRLTSELSRWRPRRGVREWWSGVDFSFRSSRLGPTCAGDSPACGRAAEASGSPPVPPGFSAPCPGARSPSVPARSCAPAPTMPRPPSLPRPWEGSVNAATVIFLGLTPPPEGVLKRARARLSSAAASGHLFVFSVSFCSFPAPSRLHGGKEQEETKKTKDRMHIRRRARRVHHLFGPVQGVVTVRETPAFGSPRMLAPWNQKPGTCENPGLLRSIWRP